jgi:predicted methyltransferase
MKEMGMHTRSLLARLAALLAAMLIGGCATPPSGLVMADDVAAIIASPDRTAADRQNDIRRKPVELIAFMGLRPGMTALDVSAGGGYTSELLARALGPQGRVYGQSQPRDAARPTPAPAAPEGGSAPAPSPAPAPAADAPRPAPRASAMALAERDQRLRNAGVAAAPIVAVAQRFDDPVPAAVAEGGLDIVTLMFNYHDFGFMGVDRTRLNAAIFRGLKRGGVYVVADHAGRPGTGISESGTLHRIEEAFLRQEVEAAGFKLLGQGQFLRNPGDRRDRNTPEPPQPKDEFVLKFIKP